MLRPLTLEGELDVEEPEGHAACFVVIFDYCLTP